MISSARLRKSENALNHARPYMEQLQNILDHIASEINDYQSPLSQNRPLRRVAIVVFAADEGLCGAFNLLLYKKLLETLKEYDKRSGGYADSRSFREKAICRRCNDIG